MIATPHRLSWWAGWDNGGVQHCWRFNRFNSDYVASACGQLIAYELVIPNPKRRCKNCERVIESREE